MQTATVRASRNQKFASNAATEASDFDDYSQIQECSSSEISDYNDEAIQSSEYSSPEASDYDYEELDQSEGSSTTTEAERIIEMIPSFDSSELSSTATQEEEEEYGDGEYLSPYENGGKEGRFKREVEDVNDTNDDSTEKRYTTDDVIRGEIKAHTKYQNITQFTDINGKFTSIEYSIDVDNMSKLRISDPRIITFKSEPTSYHPHQNIIFTGELFVPSNFIGQKSPGEYLKGHLNESDKAVIRFRDSYFTKTCKILNVFPKESAIVIVMELSSSELEKLSREYLLSVSTSYEGEYTINVETDDISFIPLDTIKRRRMKSLHVIEQHVNSPEIISALLGSPMEEKDLVECTADLSELKLTENQLDIVKKATTRKVSVVKGPPGTGKTHVIGAIVYSHLQQYPNERILVCGTSNQSVKNIVTATGKLVDKLGKSLVWLGSQRKDFRIDSENEITGEEEYLMFNRMIKRDSEEAAAFRALQELKLKRPLTKKEVDLMNKLRNKLEENISYESNVVCCTLEAAGKKSLDKLRFTTVIIDEATQALEPSSLIPLIHHAKQMVLFGDNAQLGPVIPRELYGMGTNYEVSFFERIMSVPCEYFKLTEQYRMHPDISRIANRLFYKNQIIDKVKPELTTNVIKDHILFIETNGSEEKIETSYRNIQEAESVFRMVEELVDSGVPQNEIGVIAPYSPQVRTLRSYIKQHFPGIDVGSVDSFQGSERNYIVISTVRSGRKLGFLTDERRMNVAITRARIAVIIIGKSKTLKLDNCWSELVSYCKCMRSYYMDLDAMIKESKSYHAKIKLEKYMAWKRAEDARNSFENNFPRLNSAALQGKKKSWPEKKSQAEAKGKSKEHNESEKKNNASRSNNGKKNQSKKGMEFLTKYSDSRK